MCTEIKHYAGMILAAHASLPPPQPPLPPRPPAMERDAISIDHQPAANLPPQRKRKAEGPANGNERLSKRLSLLNLGK